MKIENKIFADKLIRYKLIESFTFSYIIDDYDINYVIERYTKKNNVIVENTIYFRTNLLEQPVYLNKFTICGKMVDLKDNIAFTSKMFEQMIKMDLEYCNKIIEEKLNEQLVNGGLFYENLVNTY